MKNELIKLFSAIPPDWDTIRDILYKHSFTKEELAEIAYEATDQCFCEYQDAVEKFKYKNIVIQNLHGYYIVEILRLLLNYGLDPNVCIGTDNALWNAQYIDFPNAGAAVMRLLLEHGGNPNLVLPDSDGTFYGGAEWSLLEDVDLDVLEDARDYGLDFSVQCWMVLAAFGKTFRDGTPAVTMLNGNNIEILKEFERFDYKVEMIDRYYYNLCIFNKETSEEVAKYS